MAGERSDSARVAVLAAPDVISTSSSEKVRSPTPRETLSILVVSSDTFPPQRVDVSVLFGEELAGRGHRIDWILQSEADCPKAHRVRWGGGEVWVGATDLGTSLWRRIRKHCLGIANDLRVFSVLRTGRHEMVIVKDKFAAGLFALLAARLLRRRFVFWLSYPFPESYLIRARDGTARYPFLYWIRGGFFWLTLYRILLPAADHVFVQSEQMRRDVSQHGTDVAKMTPVPMGVRAGSVALLDDAKPRQMIPAAQPCFLYLGTLIRVRRLDFLIRVLGQVRASIPGAKLYFVGSGDDPKDEQLLRTEAARLGLTDAVEFLGQLPQARALRYVCEADVCVSPFFPTPILNSTSPTKLVEYMAMGKAVVANDHPEQRLIIDESGGGYCVPWDESRFAAAIVSLISDPEGARRMGQQGRRYVMQHRVYRAIADVVEQQLLKITAVAA